MTKFYFAGKIDKNDWRTSLAGSDIGDWIYGDGKPYPIKLRDGVEYVGPWYIACDHGCYHGRNNHGAGASRSCGYDMTKSKVHNLCLDGIKKCDVLFAWIDSDDCYGTLSEIGYAAGLGKKVWISYDWKFLKSVHNPEMLYDYVVKDGCVEVVPEIHQHVSPRYDMWFIDQYASRISIGEQPDREFWKHIETNAACGLFDF